MRRRIARIHWPSFTAGAGLSVSVIIIISIFTYWGWGWGIMNMMKNSERKVAVAFGDSISQHGLNVQEDGYVKMSYDTIYRSRRAHCSSILVVHFLVGWPPWGIIGRAKWTSSIEGSQDTTPAGA
jgi:hypothetical protein